MDYSLRELECFLAVAEERSFTRAAERLNLAQPPLSRHVRSLEEKIGAALFVRGPRRTTLTAAGALFYEETRHVPRRLLRAGEAARRTALGESARLRLGFVSAVMNEELVGTLRRFRERHPSVQVMLHDTSPNEQLRAISDGRLDGGFVGIEPPDAPPGVEFIPWRQEPLACFLPVGHALAGRKRLPLAELAGESFIAVSGESAPAFARLIRERCKAAGFQPRIVLESPRAQAVAVMVAAGSGIAILPKALASLPGNSVAAVPLQGSPAITHVFARPAGTPSPALRDFLPCLRPVRLSRPLGGRGK